MVFSTTNLFKGIQCPEGPRCTLTNCIFGHDLQPQRAQAPVAIPVDLPVHIRDDGQALTSTADVEPRAKKRKVTYGSLAEKPVSRAETIRDQLAASRLTKSNASTRAEQPKLPTDGSERTRVSASLARPVSPPTIAVVKIRPGAEIGSQTKSAIANGNEKISNTVQAKTEIKPELLNPRLIPNDPAGHAKRSLYLKHIHAEVSRLNSDAVKFMPTDLKGQLPLSKQMIVKIVLDEEEKIAREQPSVYGNVIKQRLFQLKKISTEDWIKQVRAVLPSAVPVKPPSDEKPIETRMRLDEEVLILPHLVADQSKLEAFEYIVKPPSEEKIASAIAAVEASKNYEECDRCAARFQVFPDRNEDGLLASNGPCRYHPNRNVFPPRAKTDAQTGPKQPYYPCCTEAVGAPGCTLHENHVFKTTSPARLASVMPFLTTPENATPMRDRDGKPVLAVTFDCEMGYTTYGLELIRLTAVTWPDQKDLLDVLVRPLGTIIDLNSRFSGVFPEHFQNSIPYDEWCAARTRHQVRDGSTVKSDLDAVHLPVVESPTRARALLCSFLTPQTPLLGHAINNDLNTTRLCHPTIVDTVVLFPHPRGLPMRQGLKALSLRLLNRRIQTAGAQGHDSKEDAITTGDLVRVKVGEKWSQMRATGWSLANGQLVPPAKYPARSLQGVDEPETTGEKRKRSGDEAS